MKGADVTKLDVGKPMEDQFVLALNHQDQDSAEKVIAQIESTYTNTGTSEDDRQKMARSMDRMRAAAAQMGRGGNTTANDMLASIDTKRKGMEMAQGFGLPSAPKAGENADDYVDKNFGQSNAERIDAAIAQIDADKTAADGAVATLEAEVQALRGVERTIADKQQQIADVKRRIQQSVDQDVKQAYQPLRRAQKNLATAQQKGNTKDIAKYQKDVTATQATYDKAKSDGADELKNSPEIAALEAETQAEITAAGGQVKLDEVREQVRDLRELDEQAKRLEATKIRLQQERAKRP